MSQTFKRVFAGAEKHLLTLKPDIYLKNSHKLHYTNIRSVSYRKLLNLFLGVNSFLDVF